MKTKRGYFIHLDDGKIEFVEDQNGTLVVFDTTESQSTQHQLSYFDKGMNKDVSSQLPDSSYQYAGSIDPALPKPDVDVYLKTGVHKIYDDKLIDEMLEVSKYYNTGNIASETENGNFWIRFMRLHDPIINLKGKSKLNVSKYRRKCTS